MDFAQRLDEIMKKRNISNYEMSKRTGFSDSLIGYWRKGERVPKADNLLNLSNFLEVSTDYLLGRSEEQNICKKSISTTIINELHPDEQELLDNFNKLSEQSKGRLLEKAENLVELEAKEKAESAEKENKPHIETVFIAARSSDNHPPEIVTGDFSDILNAPDATDEY